MLWREYERTSVSQNTTQSVAAINRVAHSLVEHHLAILRDVATPPMRFRQSMTALAMILGGEVTRSLPTVAGTVQTPVGQAQCQRMQQSIAIVPILRAGLGLVEPLLTLMPEAQVWHLGLYRDESDASPVSYYDKLPPNQAPQLAIIADPMLATGGSIMLAIERLRNWGVSQIHAISVIAAPEGIERVQSRFPDISITVAAIDECLNESAFIVPGLGDAGDRIFNTLPGA